MQKKIFLNFLIILLISAVLFIIVSNKSVSAVNGNDPGHTTFITFVDNNNGTDWQVYARYTSACCGVVAWNLYSSVASSGWDIGIPTYRPRNGDRVTWMTSCVDPVVSLDPVSIGLPLVGNLHAANVNVTCRQGDGGVYRACDAPNGHGFVRFSQVCPGTPDCATRGLLEICNAGTTSCGSGGSRCNRVRQVCNFNASFGNWCQSTTVNTNVVGCIGEGGCQCINDSHCRPPATFCGSGGNRCDLRENYCNNSNQCAVQTRTPSASTCNGEQNCCQNASHCNANQYCHNPPDGECRTFTQIGGRVFEDVNANNNWDSGPDNPLQGKTVQRRGASASSWAESDTTNAQGRYLFDGKNNPSNHDLRVVPGEYDTTCTYLPVIRTSNPRNNVAATPTLNNVNFMLRPRDWAVPGTVWRDANNNGVRDGADVRVGNNNIIVRVNALNGNFIGSDRVDNTAGNAAPRGNVWIPGLVHGRTYIVTLNRGSLPSGWDVIGSNQATVTINCANAPRVHFLVTGNPTTPPASVPDLTIDSFTITSGPTSSNATGSITVSNDGNAGTGAGFSISINRGDGTITPINTGSLAANATRNNIPFTITRPGAANTYTATATVDSGNAIAESNEGNNTATTYYDAGGGSGGVDLEIVSFTIPSADINTTSNGSITVRNAGDDPTPSGFSISVDNGTGNLIPVGAPALAAGATSAPIGFTINIPGSVNTYTAVARVDSTNLISETDEANNTATTYYNATFTPPTYSIQGGVFIDSIDALQNSDGIRQSGEPFASGAQGTLNISSVGNRSGNFTVTGLLQNAYVITYNLGNLPAGWEITYPVPPAPLTNPSVQISLGDPCNEGNHLFAQCDTPSLGDISGVYFGIRQIPATPWFNGIGGDMRSDNTLVNRIPNGANKYFSERNSNQTAGVVFGNFVLSPLTSQSPRISNSSNWLVIRPFSANIIHTAYDSMQATLSKNGVWNTRTNLSCTQSSCILPATLDGIYTSGDLKITSDYDFNDGTNVIIMINGNLEIQNDITVQPGSTVMFIVSGEIKVAPNVIEIQGIFSANERFFVEGGTIGTGDDPLEIQGSVIANSGRSTGVNFTNERNLLSGNETTPSVQIIYRPDFVLNAPAYIKFSNYSIKEVAPGSSN